MRHLAWNEPDERDGWGSISVSGSYSFGKDITENFNATNYLKTIIRSHSLKMSGYEWTHNRNVLTIFSAPNYWGKCGNLGAIAEIDEHLDINIVEFWSRSSESNKQNE